MNTNQQFQTFYTEYLGLDKKQDVGNISVCISNYRDIPMNKHYCYKLIATTYQGQRVLSCSEDFQDEEILSICEALPFDQMEEGIVHSSIHIRDYETSCMFRMLQPSDLCFEVTEVICLPDGKEVTFLYMENYKKHLAVSGDTLVGYCKISDVISGYGNIVVWVDEAYRRMGMAENLVKLSVNQCRREQIIPMYLVKSDNIASVTLAKKLQFDVVQREFTACHQIV